MVFLFVCYIVTLCLRCTVFELFDWQLYCDLETWDTQARSSQATRIDPPPYDFLLMFHSSHGPIWVRLRDKGRFQSPTVYFALPLTEFPLELGIAHGVKKPRMMGLSDFMIGLAFLDTIPACDRRTDRPTDSATFKPKIVGGRSPFSFPSLPFPIPSLPFSLSSLPSAPSPAFPCSPSFPLPLEVPPS